MKLDRVHDIQTAYRKLIDSMSRPGKIADLVKEADKLDSNQGCLPATLLVAQMLLDTEVAFAVVSERKGQTAHLLSQLTYAKETVLHEADYIFVMSDAASGELVHALETAKIGELKDPHHSATLIIESESVSSGTKLRLTGPGIQATAQAEISSSESWIEARAERNDEFPLGLDLIFTDKSHRLLALPRTTQVVKEEG
ncbi:phosphonate C-P lyase system protein PhnH [Paenibacillus sp. RC67]|uniref:phosphonate C-P lyase system protein PhnH n=1 Tax=Paenibacillus sp. RC67 TaxID=3039392 RepID=UPI0024ADB225|nr:phosphonate C-P lyase system protein PhnH [Paenibacillus sp. RC67]